jgi:WD40 repeat protein
VQILELETQVSALQEEIRTAPAARNASAVDWVPKGPARHTFSGHRSPITRVAFHPVFSLIATASEDTTIKIWDWETGEFERTLKGHTKEVKDVDFDARGTRLGRTMLVAPLSRSLFRSIGLIRPDYPALGNRVLGDTRLQWSVALRPRSYYFMRPIRWER